MGTDADADQFASYAYDGSGRLATEGLNNGGITRSYAYNGQGRLTQLSDAYFSETLTYGHAGLVSSAAYAFTWASLSGGNIERPADYGVTGGYYQLLIKIFIQGAFESTYAPSKDLIKSSIGHITTNETPEFKDILDFDEPMGNSIRKERLEKLFQNYIVPFTNKALSKSGIRELADKGEIFYSRQSRRN